jgi:hypothetical protein
MPSANGRTEKASCPIQMKFKGLRTRGLRFKVRRRWMSQIQREREREREREKFLSPCSI